MKDLGKYVLRLDAVEKGFKTYLRFTHLMRIGRIFYVNNDYNTPYYIRKGAGIMGGGFAYEIRRVDTLPITEQFKKGKRLIFRGYVI